MRFRCTGLNRVYDGFFPTNNFYLAILCSVFENPQSSRCQGESFHLFSDVRGAATKLLTVGASKLMSWGSSFLGKKADPEEKKTPKVEPPTPVTPR